MVVGTRPNGWASPVHLMDEIARLTDAVGRWM
jgi:hypothetical protein